MNETEADFMSWVLDYARLKHWRVAHFRPAKTEKGWRTAVQADGAGFPDLVMVRGKRCIVAELKSEKGRASAAQIAWLESLINVPSIEVFSWKPSDRRIVEVLLA